MLCKYLQNKRITFHAGATRSGMVRVQLLPALLSQPVQPPLNDSFPGRKAFGSSSIQTFVGRFLLLRRRNEYDRRAHRITKIHSHLLATSAVLRGSIFCGRPRRVPTARRQKEYIPRAHGQQHSPLDARGHRRLPPRHHRILPNGTAIVMEV